MKALQVTAFDGPSAAHLADVPVPERPARCALVRVRAAGINYADVAQSRGLYLGGPEPPYIAGMEAAGEVLESEPGSGFAPGARVMAMGRGAFAETMVAPVKALLPLPDAWSFEQGAAFPVQWLTAHGCLRTCGRLVKGESVLVHAAAGGVGIAAVRLAKHFGARVFATASSPEKLEVARANGADELIDYSQEDFAEEVHRRTDGRGVDLILEMVGGETFEKNLRAIVPFGRIVVFGSASSQAASIDNVRLIFRPVEVIGYHLAVMSEKRPDLLMAQMAEVIPLVQSGVITPDRPTVYPLAQGAHALTELQSRRTTGKLVLVP